MFRVNSLEILKKTKNENTDKELSLYKNLKPGIFYFNSLKTDNNFFGDGINIQAIVGKNGMGKSSLMDLFYMAVNNFAYMFERGNQRNGASSLCFVKGLYVNVAYSLDDVDYVLKCNGNKVSLLKKTPLLIKGWSSNESFDSIADFEITTEYALPKAKKMLDGEIGKLVEKFFYTIVSNYSLQSFISSNYISKDYYVFNPYERKDVPSYRVDDFGKDIKKKSENFEPEKKTWIDSVFHKNDGYIRSLVLNPFRDKGVINMETEKKLSQYRIVSLLIDSKQNKTNIFNEYVLDEIEFRLDHSYILRKFGKNKRKLVKDVKDSLSNSSSEECWIKTLLNLKISEKSSDIQLIALAYLKQKIHRIVETYDSYKCYRNEKKDSKDCKSISTDYCNWKNNYGLLKEQILSDPSHIVSKIKQTIHFLEVVDNSRNLEWFEKPFTYSFYADKLKNGFDSLDQIINELPPPFFKYDILVNKVVDKDDSMLTDVKYCGFTTVQAIGRLKIPKKNHYYITTNSGSFTNVDGKKIVLNEHTIVKWTGSRWKKTLININTLSSGELQMMHTLSTHAYHIRNLMSAQQNSIKYNNINLVFDEVEICFHPEYQRQFVSRLRHMLSVLKNGKECCYNFNVFILTHSPFILSDIPKTNVMYMQDGRMKKESHQETFGQNIGALLYDSFFLNCFVGEFAKEKINQILDEFDKNRKMDEGEFEKKIEILGDEFLRVQMKKYFENKKV